MTSREFFAPLKPPDLSIRGFLRAGWHEFVARRFAGQMLGAFVFGVLVTLGLSLLLPASAPLQPYSALAASFAINLTGLGILLAWLPVDNDHVRPFRFVLAWMACTLLGAAAYAGIALVSRTESAHTFLVLWMLLAAQAAAFSGIYGLFARLFHPFRYAAKQILFLILAALATGLFWIKTPIQNVSSDPAAARNLSAIMAEGTLNLSPSAAVGSVWYRESDAAREESRRFDLIRAPLTYDFFIGSSGLTIAYPDILPGKSEKKGATAGLILTLLLWGVPLAMLSDIFCMKKAAPDA